MIKLLENLLNLLEKSPSTRCQRVKITDTKNEYLKTIKKYRDHLKLNLKSLDASYDNSDQISKSL